MYLILSCIAFSIHALKLVLVQTIRIVAGSLFGQEYKTWKKSASFLYDVMLSQNLDRYIAKGALCRVIVEMHLLSSSSFRT